MITASQYTATLSVIYDVYVIFLKKLASNEIQYLL